MRRFRWLAMLALLGTTGNAAAEVPDVVTFSGVLFADDACCGFSYDGPVTVRLFAQETGGDPLWQETHPDLAVDQGYFAVELGTAVPLDPAALQSDCWLEVELSGPGVLSPRLRLTSVPFALLAGDAAQLQGHEPSDFAAADHSHSGTYVEPAQVEEIAGGICYDSAEELELALDGWFAPVGHDHSELYVDEGQADAVDTDMIQDAAISLAKLAPECLPGQVIRMTGAGWECGEAPQGITLTDLACLPGQVAQFDGLQWGCEDIAPTPPLCNGPGAALQFDGKAFKCVLQAGLETDAWGYVWDDVEHYPTTWANANAACKAAGGRLPTVTELYRVSAVGSGQIGSPYDVNYLWTNNQWHPAYYTIVRLTDGSVTGETATNARPYRCVYPNNDAAFFSGNHCYGPPGKECYAGADQFKRYNIDSYDRPPLTFMGAVDECNFYHAHLASPATFAELVPFAPGLGAGTNNWLWTSDSSRYDAVDLVRWNGTDLLYSAAGNYASFAVRTPGSYRFRCIGVGYPAGTHPNAVAGEFVAEETYLKSESADRPKAKLADAISACFESGGHLPLERDMMELIRGGLPNGPNAWIWTADASRPEYQQVVLWNAVDLNFTDYYSQNSTWVDRSPSNQYPFRCAWFPIDMDYGGPSGSKCVVDAPCYVTEKGPDVKARMWADPTDRAPLNYITAVQTCYGLGGHLASFRDLFELIRDGLPQGSGTWVWTTDAAGDNGAYVMVVKWTAMDKEFNGTSPAYATYSDKNAATARPYRCVWSNELR